MRRNRLITRGQRRGFTLLELMIVLAIISIFAAMGITELSELIPRFRARKAANTFAAHLEHARQLAMLHNRETQVEVIDFDTTLADASTYGGRWQISVGNRSVGSTDWDVLPFEEGTSVDVGQGEGDFDIGEGGNIQARYVALNQPAVDAVVFNPRGWLANSNADFGGVGYITFTFTNQMALAQSGVDDSYVVRVYRGGMVRVEPTLGRGYDNDSAGYDPRTSENSTAPSGSGS
ncbi:MAG: GspH/FimT family pseudopilin [Alphaproteobacteria bacterium]|nr:GspH/FimT family pseudopilin [Alphaproteobacteria bacterium]